ncbi:MAG TPA: mechanosensitive ion channel family protein [Candidatus Acidoferrum sp.]|nr:mechanosensitive ion channel family protein [Candidatus Acidoferrum sp.]
MKISQRLILVILVVLAVASLGAVLYTRSWADYHKRLRALWLATNHSSTIVDTHALDTAQQLAPLAVTRLEKTYAQEALRLADHSVDLAFAAALEDATENPAPLTPQTRALVARINETEGLVAADQDKVDQLKKKVASARASQKDKVQNQLDLAQAQLALDQDALDDAHDDLIRAGGDKHARIQQLLDQHEAQDHKESNGGLSAAESAASEAAETTQAANVMAQAKAWLSLHSKEKQLQQARQEALQRSASLSAQHDELDKRLAQEKAEKRIIRRPSPPSSHPSSPKAKPIPATPSAATPAPSAPAPAAPPQPQSDTQAALSLISHLSSDQKTLGALDKRIEDEQDLAANYATWITLVQTREQAFLHGILKAVFWIVLIALCVFLANGWVQRFFSQTSMDRRELHTARALLLFAVQVAGVVLILLVIFGVPQNFATVAALAGAGLTVAMKDFIMGFIGWFVLMGKDGIRPGDWVEINGVAGEVVEVGVLHTVLMETGDWNDASHPTGRKVTFNNSFAIEGHYFNFSASGQWLWDQIEILVPQTADPAQMADSIHKLVDHETSSNAKLAEQEWRRVAPTYTHKDFSAEPSVVLRPTGGGVNLNIRYLTRVNERADLRARLYRSIVELLRGNAMPDTVGDAAPAKS